MQNLTAIVVKWANLSLDGGVYYLRFHGFAFDCYGNINFNHITRWRPIVEDILIPIGKLNLTSYCVGLVIIINHLNIRFPKRHRRSTGPIGSRRILSDDCSLRYAGCLDDSSTRLFHSEI